MTSRIKAFFDASKNTCQGNVVRACVCVCVCARVSVYWDSDQRIVMLMQTDPARRDPAAALRPHHSLPPHPSPALPRRLESPWQPGPDTPGPVIPARPEARPPGRPLPAPSLSTLLHPPTLRSSPIPSHPFTPPSRPPCSTNRRRSEHWPARDPTHRPVPGRTGKALPPGQRAGSLSGQARWGVR
jgi:hypothetical protein